MESRARALGQADSRALARRRWLTGLARAALGLGLLAALVFFGADRPEGTAEACRRSVGHCRVPRAFVLGTTHRGSSLEHSAAGTGGFDRLRQSASFRRHRSPRERPLAG